MNSKHQKTLEAIFATPTKINIEFSAIEKLLQARPYQVEAAREFLERMGFKP